MEAKDVPITREYLIELLHSYENITVEFTKKDGDKRKMNCTLHPDKLPKQKITEDTDKPKRKQNLDIISVWDLEKEAWRSFRVDSVTAFQFSI